MKYGNARISCAIALAAAAVSGVRAVPPNDLCPSAIPVAVPSATPGTTIDATLDGVGTCGTSNTAPGVWYSLIGTGGFIVATTCDAPGSGGSATYDTKISVFTGTCAGLVCVGGNDDSCAGGTSTLRSTVGWCSNAGQQYLVLVHGFSSATGSFVLAINDGGACPEGACCFNDGSCISATQPDCQAKGGAYQGNLTDCGAVTCTQSITSADGAWRAVLDAAGQVAGLFPEDQPTLDNVFETLVYEAGTHSGGLSRRVETNYTVTIGPIVDQERTHSFTRLEKSDGALLSIEIENFMISSPEGGVLVVIRAINKGTEPIDTKLFYYCDFDISQSAGNDEAETIFDPGTNRLLAIEQFDFIPPAKPLWFGGCPNYKSWQIGLFPALRNSLDAGIAQLGSIDGTVPGPADHTCALSTEAAFLEPGQSIEMQTGIGAPGFSSCGTEDQCPWDCGDPANGVIDVIDLLALLGQYDATAPVGCDGGSCDFDGNGCVDVTDLLKLLGVWNQVCTITIPAGIDCWHTSCGATKASFCETPIPADFFAPGSLPFSGVIHFSGAALGADTIVERLADMVFPAIIVEPVEVTVPIELVQLNLVSCQPIIVNTFQGPTFWNVVVDLSEVLAPPGQMTVRKTHANGGTFSSTFFVQPVFTFTNVQNPNDVRVLDTGKIPLPPDILIVEGPMPWVHDLDPNLPIHLCTTDFHPGIADPDQGDQCCVPVCHSGESADHCVVADPDCTMCPMGACCLGSGACVLALDAADCGGLGGQYKGDGTTCADSDGDQLPDVVESNDCCSPPGPCSTGSSPVNPDTDGDGIADGLDPDPCAP